MILLKKFCQAQWLVHAVYNASQDTHAMFFAFFQWFAASACTNVKQSAIVDCFKHCLEKEELRIEPVEVPPGFTRAAWESQIDMEDYSEQDVEDEIQALIEKGASMDPDMQTHEEKELIRTGNAMK